MWGGYLALGLRSLRGGTEYKNPSSLKIRKKYEKMTKSPISRLGPTNTKKIQKNYKIGQIMTIFVIFRYFFRIFGAKPEMGDVAIFSYFFRISRLEGVFVFCATPERSQHWASKGNASPAVVLMFLHLPLTVGSPLHVRSILVELSCHALSSNHCRPPPVPKSVQLLACHGNNNP